MTLEAKDLVWLVVQACEIQSGRAAEAAAQVDLNLLGCNIHLNFSIFIFAQFQATDFILSNDRYDRVFDTV